MSKWLITGQIIDQRQKAVPNLNVFLMKKTSKGEDLIKMVETGAKGNYKIEFTLKDSKLKTGTESNYFLEVYFANGKQLLRTIPKAKIAPKEVWNLTVHLKNEEAEKNQNAIEVLISNFFLEENLTANIQGVEVNIAREKFQESVLIQKLKDKGIFDSLSLVTLFINNPNIEETAKSLGVKPTMLLALLDKAAINLPKGVVSKLNSVQKGAKYTGNLRLDELPTSSEKERLLKVPALDTETLDAWLQEQSLVDKSEAYESVDLRPYLGPARNQGGLLSCTSFCATAIIEAFENKKDTRRKALNLSEAHAYWNAKNGQLYAGGGSNGAIALGVYEMLGNCEEIYHPYNEQLVGTNILKLPISDEAIDRAHLYRGGKYTPIELKREVNMDGSMVWAPLDVDLVKNVLKTGRCVGLGSTVNGWDTENGIIRSWNNMDFTTTHCTTIIGYIEREGLPKDYGGGFFIVRNSWAYVDPANNLLGPDYAGHLVMPYSWYEQYAGDVFTIDKNVPNHKRKWLAEYYYNTDLKGEAIENVRIGNLTVDVPEEVNDVRYEWGNSSVFKYSFPNYSRFLPDLVNNISPVDHFSVRFTKLKYFTEGYYRFNVKGTDGIRLYIDDELVINEWKQQGEKTHHQEHYVKEGEHTIRIEYFDKYGKASLFFWIEPLLMRCELYSNTNLLGNPARVKGVGTTNFEWRHTPPVVQDIRPGLFSMRVIQSRHFKEGTYQFHALHSGGCRIKVDGWLVFDDWSGNSNGANFIPIQEGIHEVIVEYKHEGMVPAWGSKEYYKAFLNYGWTDKNWKVNFYDDAINRRDIASRGFNTEDSHYQAYRVHSLKGEPIHSIELADTELNAIKTVLEMGGIFRNRTNQADSLSASLKRRVFVEEDGYYIVRATCEEAIRFCVDGKQCFEHHNYTDWGKHEQEIWLKAGFHDLSIEFANTWGSARLEIGFERAKWDVQYFEGTNFEQASGSEKTVNSINDIIKESPIQQERDYSVQAKRTIYKPLGTYLFNLKGDDGVRLRVNGEIIIDKWYKQDVTSHTGKYEHHGGEMFIEIDYFEAVEYRDEVNKRAFVLPTLKFEMAPIGFFAEYYRGVNFEKAVINSNPPTAYRFEPSVNFSLGSGNLIPRLGSNNFSARWHGQVDLPVGRYSVEVHTDGGVRLFIDGRMVISELDSQTPTTHKKKIDLVGRYHNVKLEYVEKLGNAFCKLSFVREI